MRFSPRLKVSILLSLFTIVTIVGTLVGMAVMWRHTAHASPSSLNSTPTHSVSLHVGAPSYSTTATIDVTLSNAGTSTIYFPDHLTNCTVILLQRQSHGRWETAYACLLAIPTSLHSLAPGMSLSVQLVPTYTRLWLVGHYRATLSYSTSPTTGPSLPIFSTRFRIS